MKVTHEGVSVEVEPCGHCAAVPRPDWVLEELKFWSRVGCSVCGEKFKVEKLYLVHNKDVGFDRWVSKADRETWIGIEEEMPNGLLLKVRVHQDCLKKAFPFGCGL